MDLKQERVISGIAASPGIVIAPVRVIARGFASPDIYTVHQDDIAGEKERFFFALERTRGQIQHLQSRLGMLSGLEEKQIFDAHLLVLKDRLILDQVEKRIEEERQNAEFAFYAVMQNYLEAMRRINDDYLKERAADLDDICQRVLLNFSSNQEDISRPLQGLAPHILVSYDLSPSETVGLDRKNVLGFVTEQGSTNSHTAILARSLGLPAIVGLEENIIGITTLSLGILDGYKGQLILNPQEETLSKYKALEEKKQALRRELDAMRSQKTQTVDGHSLELAANMEFVEELALVRESGAEGIGLFRTEFYLLEGGKLPSEEEQAKVYTQVVQSIAPHRVIVRTLDAGGDKLPLEHVTTPEPNPFLGWRGIRISLDRQDFFKEQLRAVLRASAKGKIAIMFPMVSGVREVRRAKALLQEAQDALAKEGIPFDPSLEVGVMIEIPSAALMAREIAREVDFFSIGTNDLIQYTVAADRINPYVAHLYNPTHPSVIRLMHGVVEAGREAGIWTGVCGEMAGDLALLPLLVGLGVNELSVGSHGLPRIKRAICSLSQEACSAMLDQALQADSSPLIAELSLHMARQCYPELLS